MTLVHSTCLFFEFFIHDKISKWTWNWNPVTPPETVYDSGDFVFSERSSKHVYTHDIYIDDLMPSTDFALCIRQELSFLVVMLIYLKL